VSGARLEIGADEYRSRGERLQQRLEREDAPAMVVFGPVRVSYLTGFFFAATERPVALVVPRRGAPVLMVPRLEREHAAEQSPQLADVRSYPEYPGGGSGRHPMAHLAALLEALGVAREGLACDHNGFEYRWGYRGPAMSAV